MASNSINIQQQQGQVRVNRKINPTAGHVLGFDSSGHVADVDPSTLTITSDTLTTPIIAGGLTASGSGSNDFSASTGTFKTSSGANTLSGAVSVADSATPSLTTATGKTNTGFVTVLGKTSGGFKITAADATAQTVTMTTAAQTVGAPTITIPDLAGTSVTPAYLATAQAFTNKTVTLSAGTASVAPLVLTSGTNLASASAGALEYDGTNSYITNETTSGRGLFGVHQYFGLQSNGSTISTIANFFGTTSNISLVSGGYYDIDIYCWFLNTTSGTVVWTFTNTAAPTSQNIYYESSPVTGIVAPPGTATTLTGQIVNDNTATKALTATSAITDAVNMYTRFKIFLKNGTGTSLKIQATKSAGSITPMLGSFWTCRRLPATNVGNFSA